MTAVLLGALLVATAAQPLSDAALERNAAGFSSPDSRVRRAAAAFVEHQGPEAVPVLARRLLRPLATRPEVFRRLFLAMWAQVPNWKSANPMWIRRPEPPWVPPPRVKGQPRAHRPKPHDPEDLDWLEALDTVDLHDPILVAEGPLPGEPPDPPPRKLALKPGAPPPAPPPPPPPPPTLAELETARAEAMEEVALLRAIAASNRMDAASPLFALAFAPGGVFRDECGRQIRAMGSYAVPALIGLLHRHGPAALHLSKQRRYAAYQLDRMDRAQPDKAISTAPDDRVRAAIIHQYGEERAIEAVDAVLAQVNASSHRVRTEARWAWQRYVTGPPPPPAPMRKRRLTGGHEESEEKPDYLTYRELALLALRKQLATIDDQPVDPKASAEELTSRLLGIYDRQRAAAWDAELALGEERARAGDLKGAVDHFGFILAHDPAFAGRAAMVESYARYGDELRQKGRLSEAVGYLRQAVDLDPKGPHAVWAGARVALCDGLLGLARGDAEPELFRRALALDPGLAAAKEPLARALALTSRRLWVARGEAVGAACAVLFLSWLLSLGIRRKRPAENPPAAG